MYLLYEIIIFFLYIYEFVMYNRVVLKYEYFVFVTLCLFFVVPVFTYL